jgi:hypothetical protein
VLAGGADVIVYSGERRLEIDATYSRASTSCIEMGLAQLRHLQRKDLGNKIRFGVYTRIRRPRIFVSDIWIKGRLGTHRHGYHWRLLLCA